MPFDPKVVSNATQKIEQHLKNFEKDKKDYEVKIAAAAKRLKALDNLTENVIRVNGELLKKMAVARATINDTLRAVEGFRIDTKDGGYYEMLQRRYLDSKKTYQDAHENYCAKLEAFEKNKADKKAKMELELAEKAGTKINGDFNQILSQAQDLVPSKTLKTVNSITVDLPADVERYEKALTDVLKASDWSRFDKAHEDMKRYGQL